MALTSPTSGGHSVGIVPLRTYATEFSSYKMGGSEWLSPSRRIFTKPRNSVIPIIIECRLQNASVLTNKAQAQHKQLCLVHTFSRESQLWIFPYITPSSVFRHFPVAWFGYGCLRFIVLPSLFLWHTRRKTLLLHFLSRVMEGASACSELGNFYCYLRK
jgi:hypothetical protein